MGSSSPYMIDAFESSFRIQPNGVFFWFIDESGREISFTYQNARLVSAALAQRLQDMGVRPGDTVIADLPNSPEFIFLILASMYGGFSLALLNNSALDNGRMARALGKSALQLNAIQLRRLLPHARELASQSSVHRSGRISVDPSRIIASIISNRRQRSIMGEEEDLIQDTVHFAERGAHIFSEGTVDITFLSGGKGGSKIVPLSWSQLTSASKDVIDLVSPANGGWQARLPLESGSLSQCVLPLYATDGFQIMVRSVLQQHPFRLYGKFDAETILHDAEVCKVTQISLRESMLQDMLAIEEWRSDEFPLRTSRLAGYEVILLCNRSLNARTLERATDMNANVFATFGMTETSGTIAASLVTPGFRGGLKVGKSTHVRIIDANMQGFGSLALRGPSIFRGYTNANTPQTVDRYFMTGDTAALYEGHIYVRNRSADMFVSAGENIYPAEIADVLRHVSGVAIAYVFGEDDAAGNKVPVAVVQQMPGALITSEQVIETAKQWLAPHSVPARVLVVEELPRTAGDKLDRQATEQLFLSHLDVKSATVHHVRLPFKESFETPSLASRIPQIFPDEDVAGKDAGGLGDKDTGAGATPATATTTDPAPTSPDHDTLVLELHDARGRVGLGECTQLGEAAYIMEVLLPALIGTVICHPRTASEFLMAQPNADKHPYAVAAVEMALWDLYGQAVKRPLWQLLNEEYQRIWDDMGLSTRYAALPRTAKADGMQVSVSAGATIGQASTQAALAHCKAAVQAGYTRVKLNIAPGKGLAGVQAIRKAFPNLLLTLDANNSFAENEIEQLRAYNTLGIGWIEDPISYAPTVDQLSKLADLQQRLATPICVDDAYESAAEAYRILNFPDLHCIAIRIPKFGGIQPTLTFLAKAKALGLVACMTGSDGTGVSRRVSAAFCTLPDMVFPSDIGSTTNQFATDITHPPYIAINGMVILNAPGEGYGLGCKLDTQVLARVEVGSVVIK